MIVGLLDPALFLMRTPTEVQKDIDLIIKICKNHKIAIVPLSEYWDNLMKTLAHPLEKELYSNRNNPAYAGAQQSMQQLRKLADLSKIHIPPLQPMSGEVWIDGFKQLFGFPHFDPSWEDVMIKAALRLLIAEYDVIMLTKKVTGRNIKFHSTGESNLEEITRWVLHLQPRGIGHKQILCVHHPRNLQEKWTVRFDWRLPAKSDNAKYPFCPPDTPDQKKGQTDWKGLGLLDIMDYFKEKLEALLTTPPLYFKDISENLVPDLPGIYCIFSNIEGKTLYVGKTKNIKERILDTHLAGWIGERIFQYAKSKNISYTKEDLMGFLINYCFVRWIIETDYKKQDSLESYLSGILYARNFPV